MNTRTKNKKDDARKRQKIAALIFVFIVVFLSIFLVAKSKIEIAATGKPLMTVLSPFQNAFSWIGGRLIWLRDTVVEIQNLHEQNEQLREEVEILRAQSLTASEFAAENQRLRALLGYKQVAVQFDLVTASVIGREAVTWSDVIVINRGTLDGVANNMAVVTDMGLVGHVVDASFNTSKVQLLLDPRSSVGTIVQRPESRVTGIVEGDINNPNHPKMVNIPKDADVQVDDMVVTSGFGGVYPKGLIVGKIKEIHNDEGGLLKYGVMDTAVNFEKLEDVAVIVTSREAPPEPLPPPVQTPTSEADPNIAAEQLQQAQQIQQEVQQRVYQAQQEQLQQAQQQAQQQDSAGGVNR